MDSSSRLENRSESDVGHMVRPSKSSSAIELTFSTASRSCFAGSASHVGHFRSASFGSDGSLEEWVFSDSSKISSVISRSRLADWSSSSFREDVETKEGLAFLVRDGAEWRRSEDCRGAGLEERGAFARDVSRALDP